MKTTPYQGGESGDFKTTTMASIQVGLSLIFPFILVRFAWGLKQIPRKNDSNMPILCDFQTKILLKSYRRTTETFGCSSYIFLPDFV